MLSSDDVKVKFMKKKSALFHFVYPEVDEIADVHINDIDLILPEPRLQTGSKRIKGFYSYAVDFTGVQFC